MDRTGPLILMLGMVVGAVIVAVSVMAVIRIRERVDAPIRRITLARPLQEARYRTIPLLQIALMLTAIWLTTSSLSMESLAATLKAADGPVWLSLGVVLLSGLKLWGIGDSGDASSSHRSSGHASHRRPP